MKPEANRFLARGPIREAAGLFRTTPENLLWNHTTFPYATAFVTEVDYDRAVREALSSATERHRFFGVSRLKQVGLRRVCQQCLREELAAYGESYWHRSHNLPGTFFCVKHRCSLHQTSLGAQRSTSTILPVECELGEPPQEWTSPGAWDLAVSSHALLRRTPGAGMPRPAQFYLSLAVEQGWLSKNRSVSQPALAQLFQGCFRQEFLKAVSVEFKESRAWPAHAFSPKSRSLSPLRQLMVETALRHGTSRFRSLNHHPKGPSRPTRQEMDNRLSAAAVAELEKVIAAGERLPLAAFMKRIGAETAWAKHQTDHPKLKLVAERVRAWNRACLKAARRPNRHEMDDRLSAAALAELERLIAANEKLEVRAFMKRIGAVTPWKSHNSELPKLRVVAERLREWNSTWLTANRRPDRQDLDNRLSAAAAAELERVISASEKMTFGAFIKRIGAVSIWQKYKGDCPKLRVVAERFRAWTATTRI